MGKKTKSLPTSIPRQPVTYTLDSPENTSKGEKKGWQTRLPYLGLTFLLGGIAIYVTRLSGLFHTSNISDDTQVKTLNTAMDDMQIATFRPGLISIADSDERIVYPYYDTEYDDARIAFYKTEEQTNYFQAMKWLNTQGRVSAWSEEDFISIVETLNDKVKTDENRKMEKRRNQKTAFREGYLYLRRDDSVNLFDSSTQTSLTSAEKKALRDIKNKVNAVILDRSIRISQGEQTARLLETLAVEIWKTGKTTGMVEQLPQDYQFTDPEKDFMDKHYTFKPFTSVQNLKDNLKRDFRKIHRHKDDPIKVAAYLHMLIVDNHACSDCNGRIARLLLNHTLKSAGLSIVYFPCRETYDSVVRDSLDTKDYSKFEKYLRGLLQENRLSTLRRATQDLNQRKCGLSTNYRNCVLTLFDKYLNESRLAEHRKKYKQEKPRRQRQLRSRN